ncbi:TPA: hypothetical protein ROX88_002429 [Bacillus pseudomycoides]|nr:hypothetical protein [Bacillus pseudomycoides]
MATIIGKRVIAGMILLTKLLNEMYLLDENELEEAYRKGDISKLEYEVAWSTAKWIMKKIEEEDFLWFSILEKEIQKNTNYFDRNNI